MTPAARVQAAIEIIDQILAGKAAEQSLTGWSRRSRYAGSKDRAAVRDHVFDGVRCLRSFAALGGEMSGRGVMLGALRRVGTDPGTIFCDSNYAPVPLTAAEQKAGHLPEPGPEACDIPDWLWSRFTQSLGEDAVATAQTLQTRAPVHLRVNLRKATIDAVQKELLPAGIVTQPHPACSTALEVTEGARSIRQSAAYLDGRVELQDAASQAVVASLPLESGMRVLDYCAGGGGKALAMAARANIELFAHDAALNRMRDLKARSERAGVQIQLLSPEDVMNAAPFDLVLCDVPCSGSGAWRRSPEGKWRLTAERLQELCLIQSEILDTAAGLVSDGGVLAYATCSVLDDENLTQIQNFCLRNVGWGVSQVHRWNMQNGADGFFVAHLTREE